MNIPAIQNNTYNNTGFRGFCITRSEERHLGISKDKFMRNPAIKDCAEKYEVLVKRTKITKFKPTNKYVTGILAAVSGILGGTAVSLFSLHTALTSSFLPTLGGLIIPPALYLLGVFYKNAKPEYEYTLQGGKRLKTSVTGSQELEGSLSKKYYIGKNIMNIDGLCEDIEKQEKDKFFDMLNKYGSSYDSDTIYKIAADPSIQKEFPDGEYFNISIDYQDNTLLTHFFDILPEETDRIQYNQLIKKMQNMKNINYNQKDSYGISVLEKILVSENEQALNLVKDFDFVYSTELDSAYENIKNPDFKKKALKLNVKFPNILKTIELQSSDAIALLDKELNSPFCKDREKYRDELYRIWKED